MMDFFVLSTLIFITSLILCLIPRSLSRIDNIKKFYPHITVFAAGFMLAMLLLDFIPHVAGICKHGNSPHNSAHHSISECKNPLKCDLHKNDEHTSGNEGNKHDEHHHHDHGHDHSSGFFGQNLGFLIAGCAFIFLLSIDSIVLHHSHCDNDKIVQMNDGLNHGAHGHSHTHDQIGTCNTSAIKETKSKIQAIIFILALSLHSLFEGLAINKQRTFGIFEVGIIVHKMLESFALGFTVHMAEFSFAYTIVLITVYSMLTPLGMAIAYFLPFNKMLNTACNGLALGSILFIVCVEMIPPNFHSKSSDFIKIASLASGYVITAIIIYCMHR
ncbi:Zinc (Zn2+)-Iron (Fe2+) Permease (ZIP) Family [Trachipleistophora hominis]|uniref:Zinc (Zn2+)-Iron (Fe2+) Permease (ZIP) Family n=1 Tax=Trachipleistophora hominis TaxID=72359 RepID=L7JWA6_TRAHO|nr:Zinc (Zn2+)-Iron (Fe2+) Permease (ZIP) Family [Trachipleistophora hominis]